jgi:glucose-6-phosphate 1-dehydrogenase
MVVRIDPKPGARIRFFGKKPGEEAFEPADFQVLFEKTPGEEPEPYERLLDDALHGEQQLFTREDMVEETWRIIEPLLSSQPPVERYPKGSWGPEGASRLVRGVCEWYDPWLPDEDGAGR